MENHFKNKLVVVTGGSGFIGSHFLLELVKRGAKVRTHTHHSPLQVSSDGIEVIDAKTEEEVNRLYVASMLGVNSDDIDISEVAVGVPMILLVGFVVYDEEDEIVFFGVSVASCVIVGNSEDDA